MKTPLGFVFSGVHAGIKPRRDDLALVVSRSPCAAAGRFTENRAMAAPIVDARARLPSHGPQAVVVNSGNANALTGEEGPKAVRAIVASAAEALSLPEAAVLTASTGVIGVPLPTEKILKAIPAAANRLGEDPLPAARAILTTDTKVKMAGRTIEVGGKEVRLFAICKGSGMIAPQLATMIAVISTDCAISPALLDRSLGKAMGVSFNSLTVDGDMSTNDAVFALANGEAKNELIQEEGEDYEKFETALTDLCKELAKQIARDGEGATKMVEVTVRGAPSDELASDFAKSIAGSSLVKAALFGCDPNWGRILSTVGARAGSLGLSLSPDEATVQMQGITVYDGGPVDCDQERLRWRMREPEIQVEVSLDEGDGAATSWGCDLSYDYVKINADDASLIVQTESGGVAKDERLSRYSPGFKVSLLLQALSYIKRFAGSRCVVHIGSAAIQNGPPLSEVAGDILLLRSAGLLPTFVHGGMAQGDETDRASLEWVNRSLVSSLNQEEGGAVGVFGRDGALLRIRRQAMASGGGTATEDLSVNGAFLEMLLGQRYLPVIAPLGIDEEGEGCVLDSERVAAEVAISLQADKLVFLADAPGILRDGELLPELSSEKLAKLVEGGEVSLGMAQKARAILHALHGGVKSVHVIDGRTPHAIISELFTDRGVGTLVT